MNKLSLGYLYDFARRKRSQWGLGAVGSLMPIPAPLRSAYGATQTAFMLFIRVKLI